MVGVHPAVRPGDRLPGLPVEQPGLAVELGDQVEGAAVAEGLVDQERLDLERPQTVLARLLVQPGAGPGDRVRVARVGRERLAPEDRLDVAAAACLSS